MLDGPTAPTTCLKDEQARIAAGGALPSATETATRFPIGSRASEHADAEGVSLIRDQHYRSRVGTVDGYDRLVRRETPKIARRYRVWFLPEDARSPLMAGVERPPRTALDAKRLATLFREVDAILGVKGLSTKYDFRG